MRYKLLFTVFSCFILINCMAQENKKVKPATKPAPVHNSQNSLDWAGTYRGTIPCADCPGIQITVILKTDLTYTLKRRYIDRSDSVYVSTGKFEWDKTGNEITFIPASGNQPIRCLVGENTLTQLSNYKEELTDSNVYRYILSKQGYSILEKYWKLISLNGNPVKVDSTFRKEPHLIIKENNCRVNANGGCNSILSNALIQSTNRISFTQGISTKMACQNMQLENDFIEMLTKVKRFSILADELIFYTEELEPLAKFKTMYMK